MHEAGGRNAIRLLFVAATPSSPEVFAAAGAKCTGTRKRRRGRRRYTKLVFATILNYQPGHGDARIAPGKDSPIEGQRGKTIHIVSVIEVIALDSRSLA